MAPWCGGKGYPPQPQAQGKEGGRGGLWEGKKRRMKTSHNETVLYSLKTCSHTHYLSNSSQNCEVGIPLNPIPQMRRLRPRKIKRLFMVTQPVSGSTSKHRCPDSKSSVLSLEIREKHDLSRAGCLPWNFPFACEPLQNLPFWCGVLHPFLQRGQVCSYTDNHPLYPIPFKLCPQLFCRSRPFGPRLISGLITPLKTRPQALSAPPLSRHAP